MPNLLDAIKNRIASEFPGATVVERGRRHIKHAIGPGRYVVDAAIGSLHYHDGTSYQEIDTDWQDSGLAGFADVVDRAAFAVHSDANGRRRIYPRRGVAGEYVELARPQYWTGSGWNNLNVGARTRTGNTLTWDRPAFGITVMHGGGLLKLMVTLKTDAAARRIRWPVSLTGLHWDGWTLVSDADGMVVVELPQPVILSDGNGPLETPRPVAASYAGGAVEFVADLTGLSYPVVIDPTLNLSIGASTDDAYSMADGTSYGDADTAIFLGKASQSYDSGWRWTGVSVPAGATIDVSYATYYFQNSSATNNYNIFAEDGNNPATFASDDLPTNRTKTTASASWSVSDPYQGTQSPSLNAIVQEVVDGNAGTGDALVLLIENGTGANYARSQVRTYDYGANFPALHIEYTEAVGGGISIPVVMHHRRMLGVS